MTNPLLNHPASIHQFGTGERTPPPRPPGPRHDHLHMAAGLRFCWCMCQRCFLKYQGDTGGICCCPQCPCQARYASTLPMYVPRRPGED